MASLQRLLMRRPCSFHHQNHSTVAAGRRWSSLLVIATTTDYVGGGARVRHVGTTDDSPPPPTTTSTAPSPFRSGHFSFASSAAFQPSSIVSITGTLPSTYYNNNNNNNFYPNTSLVVHFSSSSSSKDTIAATNSDDNNNDPRVNQPPGTATITFVEKEEDDNDDDGKDSSSSNDNDVDVLPHPREHYTVPIVVRMPDMSEEDDENNTVEKWYKHPGDIVKHNDVLCDIGTPDFTFGMVTDDEDDAIMGELHVTEGTKVADNTPICTIYHYNPDANSSSGSGDGGESVGSGDDK